MKAMRAFSIVERVARAQLLTMTGAMALVISIGTLVGGVTSLRREDAVSLGVAGVVRAEIREHLHEGERLDRLLREEITEQGALGRHIEVWQGRRRLGDDGAPALLGPAPRAGGGCATERRAGRQVRVCALSADAGMRIVVGTHLEPLFLTVFAVSGAMAAIALASVLVLWGLGRRLVRRLLLPLSAFGERIATMDADRTGDRLPASWGAQEIDTLAARFNALLARIDDSVGRERRFLLDVSHELRSPLSRLQAQLDLLIEESASEPDAPLQRAAAACAGLVRLTESVLALGRDEPPAGETVNLCDLLRAYQIDLADREPPQAARLHVDAQDEVLLRADPALLRLCLVNLIENALKFSTGSVRIAVAEDGPAVLLSVQDRGPGIPDEEVERVGEPFFRGRRGRGRVPGSGLGLALVRHVVQQHGGQLTFHRPDAGGLRVEVRLPGWQPAPDAG